MVYLIKRLPFCLLFVEVIFCNSALAKPLNPEFEKSNSDLSKNWTDGELEKDIDAVNIKLAADQGESIEYDYDDEDVKDIDSTSNGEDNDEYEDAEEIDEYEEAEKVGKEIQDTGISSNEREKNSDVTEDEIEEIDSDSADEEKDGNIDIEEEDEEENETVPPHVLLS